MNKQQKFILIDCDSTLSGLEGIDELARMRGEEIFTQVEAMTNASMNGFVKFEDVLEKRLNLIRPSKTMVQSLAGMYCNTIESTAVQTIKTLKENGWMPMVVSGGFRQAIIPLAQTAGINVIEAIDLFFNEQGEYAGFDHHFPTAKSGGKIKVVETVKAFHQPTKIVMVGDGSTDLEIQSSVDLFVGFGGFVEREKVKKGSKVFIKKLEELLNVL